MRDMSIDDLLKMRGKPVYSSDGQKIGGVDAIYLDEDTNQPEWIGLGSGLFGSKRIVVPVSGLAMEKDGIKIPYGKEQVKDAPGVGAEEISRTTEAELYRHYGLQSQRGSMTAGVERPGTGSMETRAPQQQTQTATSSAAMQQRPGAGGGQMREPQRAGGDTITLKEERIHVEKRDVTTGKMRLHKYVDTRQVTEDIELRKESARVERTPINRPVAAGEFAEQEITIELHEEMPVVTKEIMATEEVRLLRETHVDHERVNDQVRKERVELEQDAQTPPRERGR